MFAKTALAAFAVLGLAACSNTAPSPSAARPTGTTSSTSSGVGFSSPQSTMPPAVGAPQGRGEGGTGGQGAAGGGSAGAAR